jgi:hypothetical protein
MLNRRKELYEALHPEAKAGAKRADGMNRAIGKNVGEMFSPTFVADTAAKTGLTLRSVQMDVKLATDLDGTAKADLRETPIADNKAALKAIAKEDAKIQREAAKKLKSGKVASVQEAIEQAKQEHGDPAPGPTDGMGIPLPYREDVRQAFAAKPLFAKLLSLQSQLTEAFNQLFDNEHGSQKLAPLRSRLEAHYREAQILVQLYAPFAMCPQCRGVQSHDGCGHCGGSGWLTKEAWDRHAKAEQARTGLAGKGVA